MAINNCGVKVLANLVNISGTKKNWFSVSSTHTTHKILTRDCRYSVVIEMKLKYRINYFFLIKIYL